MSNDIILSCNSPEVEWATLTQETHAPICFSGFTLDVVRGRLLFGKVDVPLRPKSFALLSHLVRNAGRVVSKDELLSTIWPDVTVTEDSLTQCVHEVRRALGSAGRTLLRTVHRRGYLFDFGAAGLDRPILAPSSLLERRTQPGSGPLGTDGNAQVEPVTADAPLYDTNSLLRRQAITVGASAMLLIGVGNIAARFRSPAPAPSATGASVYGDSVVLSIPRFLTETGDVSLARYAGDLWLQVAGALAGTRLITVIDTGITSSLRGAGTDPPSRETGLGSRFILRGALVRKSVGVRATVWLVDATSGARLWSADYDYPTSRIGHGRDDLGDQIAAATFGEIRDAAREAAARKPEADLRSFELVLLANEHRWLWSPEGNDAAIDLVQGALAIEPRSAMAWAELARLYGQRVWAGFGPSLRDDAARWEEAATKAVAADGNYTFARAALADYHMYTRTWDAALAEMDRALALAPWLPEIMAFAGELVLPWLGQSRRAAALVDRAKRLDPASIWKDAEAVAYFFVHRFRESAAAVEWMPEPSRWMQLFVTLSYAQLGDGDALERWRDRLRQGWPDYAARDVEATSFAPLAEAERALWRMSHMKAGLAA
ncbi:winged helix-turn-helix domain-containing protein [Palleronia sp. KMU-117]|uniref:winged helix-turn-helix domain-containing protein n=1 Tax=Palleronia sp. KMU-117 TaxID=3434108 RepID=UPI003D74AF65